MTEDEKRQEEIEQILKDIDNLTPEQFEKLKDYIHNVIDIE